MSESDSKFYKMTTRESAVALIRPLMSIITKDGTRLVRVSSEQPSCPCDGKEFCLDLGVVTICVMRNPEGQYRLSVESAEKTISTGFCSDFPELEALYKCIEERLADDTKKGGE